MSRWLRVAEEDVNSKAKRLLDDIFYAERYLEDADEVSGLDADLILEKQQIIKDNKEQLKSLLSSITNESLMSEIQQVIK